MASPVRKSAQPQNAVAKVKPQVRWSLATPDTASIPSPALQMQADLEMALRQTHEPVVDRWSTRRALAFMTLASAGLWVGVGLLIRAV